MKSKYAIVLIISILGLFALYYAGAKLIELGKQREARERGPVTLEDLRKAADLPAPSKDTIRKSHIGLASLAAIRAYKTNKTTVGVCNDKEVIRHLAEISSDSICRDGDTGYVIYAKNSDGSYWCTDQIDGFHDNPVLSEPKGLSCRTE